MRLVLLNTDELKPFRNADSQNSLTLQLITISLFILSKFLLKQYFPCFTPTVKAVVKSVQKHKPAFRVTAPQPNRPTQRRDSQRSSQSVRDAMTLRYNPPIGGRHTHHTAAGMDKTHRRTEPCPSSASPSEQNHQLRRSSHCQLLSVIYTVMRKLLNSPLKSQKDRNSDVIP